MADFYFYYYFRRLLPFLYSFIWGEVSRDNHHVLTYGVNADTKWERMPFVFQA